MGNILGFVIPLALAITQPQLFGIAFKYIARGAKIGSDKVKLWNSFLRSLLVSVFWHMSLFAAMVEIGLVVVCYFARPELGAWYSIPLTFGVAQFFYAWFNYRAGASKSEKRTLHGKEYTASTPLFPGWAKHERFARPMVWLAVASLGFLAQGALLEYYALTRVDSYTDQQTLIFIAFLSKVMYGVMAFTAANIFGWILVKGTRFLERTSTIIAKLIVSIDLNIEYNKNALQEIGGEIDFLDEDYIAGKIKYLFTVLFTPFIILDLAIFVWPSQLIALLIMFGIVAVGLLELVFGSMTEATKTEAFAARVKRMRLVFNLGPTVGMITLALAYGFQTTTGRNLMVELENFWHGVNFIPYRGFWFPLFIVTPMCVLAAWLLRKAWIATEAYVQKRDSEPHETTGYKGDVVSYISILLMFVWTGFGAAAFLIGFSAFASCAGSEKLQLSDNPLQEAVHFQNVKVNGVEVKGLKDKRPWPLSAPENGQMYVEFDTEEKIFGIVEFIPPSAAIAAGMDTYKPLNSEKQEDSVYHHVADFDVPDNFSGSYRIVVRNAELSPQVNPRYGRIARSETFDRTIPEEAFYKSWWESLKAWWSDDDNDNKRPPRTVVVHRYGPSPRPASAPRSTGCKVKPLKVPPSLRNEVAAARRH